MRSESLEATEQRGSEGATHPRVKLSDIEDAVESTEYHRFGPDGILTVCLCTMKNGFIVVGKSAPASPENFNADKGEAFAYEDCIRQLWPLMGFALRDRLAADG